VRKNQHVTSGVRENLTEEVTFCDRIVALSAAQREVREKHSLHDEKKCERTWPTGDEAGCFMSGLRGDVEGAVVVAGERN